MIVVDIAVSLVGIVALYRVFRYLLVNVRLAAFYGFIAAIATAILDWIHSDEPVIDFSSSGAPLLVYAIIGFLAACGLAYRVWRGDFDRKSR